jgi:hypothetical protein
LGWDTTVKIHAGGFDTISVCGTEYKVTKMLSAYPLSILGHATRVFAAEELDTKEKRVIKEVWVDNSREREFDIQAALVADLEKAGLLNTKEWLFTHKCHEDARTSNGEADSTAAFSQDVDGRDISFEDLSTRAIRFRRQSIWVTHPIVSNGCTSSHQSSSSL